MVKHFATPLRWVCRVGRGADGSLGANGRGGRVMWGLEGLGGESKIKGEVQGPLGWQIWWGMYALGVYGPKGPKYGKICTSFF